MRSKTANSMRLLEPRNAGTKRRVVRRFSRKLHAVFLLTFTSVAMLTAASTSHAQKIYLIASLHTSEQFVNAFEGFKSRMTELGYKEGQTVRYENYNAKGDQNLIRAMAEKLVQQKPDMIVTTSTSATLAAAKVTEATRIPVVFLSAGNAQKLVKSFATSGSNLAGISSASLELVGKRFELLQELAPKTKRIAMPLDPNSINYSSNSSEARQAAAKLSFTVIEIPVATREELFRATSRITRKDYDAIFIPPDSLVSDGVDVLVKQAIHEKIPIISSLLALVKRGCLASYAADYVALGRQGAIIADKIFKGTKPSDIPVELPYKLNLALNLATAKAIDLKVPKDVLLRVDQVIE